MNFKLLNRKDATLTEMLTDYGNKHSVSLKLGNVLPDDISEMKAMRFVGTAPHIKIALYALRECITELTIKGKDYNPRELSFTLDTRDDETEKLCYVIAAIVMEAVVLDEEALKKLKQQREISSQEAAPSSAKTAQKVKKG